MNRPRWQKIISDLWGNRTRSILVVASIAVGLFAIGVIATIYTVIAADMRAGFVAVNPANIYIQSDLFDKDVITHLRQVEGVYQVEGTRVVDLRVKNQHGNLENMQIKTVPDWNESAINRLIVKQGQWPPRRGEIVVDQHKLPGLGVKLGDMLVIELPSGKTRSLKLVGVVQDLTIGAYSGGGGFFHAPAHGYLHRDDLEKLEQDDPYLLSGVYATISGNSGDSKRAEQVAALISRELENDGIAVKSTTARSAAEHPNAYLIDAIVGVLFVLGLLVVFLSGFLITNTLQSLMNQQVQQIGIMKTVGGRRGQIIFLYMLLILMFGLLAFLIAMPLADRVSFFLLEFLAGQLNFVLQGQRLILPVVAMQAGLALLMPQLAAWLPIWQGTKISVQEALSGISQGQGNASDREHDWLDRFGQARHMQRPLLIAIRNTFRRRGRLLLTLTTLTLGGAIFIATFNVQVSMGRYMDQIAQYFLADVNVTLDQPYRVDEIRSDLAQVGGVGMIEGWASARSEIVLADGSSGERVQLLAPPPGSRLVKPVIMQGRWIQPGDRNAIVLNEQFLSKYPDLILGSTLRLKVNERDSDWQVVGFFQFAGKNGGLITYTSYDYLSTLIGQSGKAVIFRIVGDGPAMTAAEQERLAQNIQASLNAHGKRVTDLETGSFLADVSGGGFATLTAFLLFLAMLTALVGSIGLAGTMSMNVMERTREIGVMRAIGASDRTLIRMVLVEGMIIGLISYLLGALLAVPISRVMADGITLAIFDAPSNFGFTPMGFAIWLAVVVVLSFLASVVPARSAARLTIREVLAYE